MNPAALKQRVLDSARAEPSRTRVDHTRVVWALCAGGAVLLALQLAHMGGPRLLGRPFGHLLINASAWLVATLVAARTAFAPRNMLGLSRNAYLAVALGCVLAPFTFAVLAAGIWPETRAAVAGHPGLVCVDLSIYFGVWPLTALVFVQRGRDPVHPVARGALLGALCGAAATTLVTLVCRYTDLRHVALGHVLPALIQVGIGALLGRAALALRASPAALGGSLGAAFGGWLAITLDLQRQIACPDHFAPGALRDLALGIAFGALLGLALGRFARRGRARAT